MYFDMYICLYHLDLRYQDYIYLIGKLYISDQEFLKGITVSLFTKIYPLSPTVDDGKYKKSVFRLSRKSCRGEIQS